MSPEERAKALEIVRRFGERPSQLDPPAPRPIQVGDYRYDQGNGAYRSDIRRRDAFAAVWVTFIALLAIGGLLYAFGILQLGEP